jgi:hypothetical protein
MPKCNDMWDYELTLKQKDRILDLFVKSGHTDLEVFVDGILFREFFLRTRRGSHAQGN